MNDPNLDLPGRLNVVGATDLERRFLAAAAHEQPSPELSRRMAAALGISAAAVGMTAVESALRGTMAGTKTGGFSFFTPWIATGALVLAVGGAVVGRGLWKDNPPLPLHPTPASSEKTHPTPSPTMDTPPLATSPGSDLREQITLIDTARSAVASRDGNRALEILRRYEQRYPAGSFKPEAEALRIEALAKLGRMADVRALAKEFVTLHSGSPLADRVAHIAGLPRP